MNRSYAASLVAVISSTLIQDVECKQFSTVVVSDKNVSLRLPVLSCGLFFDCTIMHALKMHDTSTVAQRLVWTRLHTGPSSS